MKFIKNSLQNTTMVLAIIKKDAFHVIMCLVTRTEVEYENSTDKSQNKNGIETTMILE